MTYLTMYQWFGQETTPNTILLLAVVLIFVLNIANTMVVLKDPSTNSPLTLLP